MRCITYFEVIMKACSIKRHQWRSVKIMDGISNFVGSYRMSHQEMSFVTKVDRIKFLKRLSQINYSRECIL